MMSAASIFWLQLALAGFFGWLVALGFFIVAWRHNTEIVQLKQDEELKLSRWFGIHRNGRTK